MENDLTSNCKENIEYTQKVPWPVQPSLAVVSRKDRTNGRTNATKLNRFNCKSSQDGDVEEGLEVVVI
jgi:hypothetical protein